jgi:hypothetical protein
MYAEMSKPPPAMAEARRNERRPTGVPIVVLLRIVFVVAMAIPPFA